MNFVAVIMLCIMVFMVIFIDKHEVLNEKEIKTSIYYEKNKIEFDKKAKYIKANMLKISVPISKINNWNFVDIEEDKYYLIIDSEKSTDISISDDTLLVLNYIKNGEKPCVFDSKYIYYDSNNKESNIKKKLRKYLVLAINYVQFFIKKDLKNAEVIFVKGNILKKLNDLNKKDIVFFGPSDIIIESEEKVKDLNRDIVKSEYGFINFCAAALSIVIGAIVTSNLLYNVLAFIFNVEVYSLKNLIYAILIYYCYMGINNVVYKPIGKLKILASIFFYIFCFENIILSLKNFYKGENMKKGISLIILVATIAVLIIITGVTIQVAVPEIDSVRLTKFTQDMETIRDAVISYYATEGNLPISGTVYNVSDLATLAQDSAALRAQIRSNNDTEDKFYKIETSLLPIDTPEIGKGNTSSDIFVVDQDMENIYYVEGIEISNQYYYCINQIKISPNSDTSNNKNTEITIVSSTVSIKLQKGTTRPTSSLGVNVTTTLGADDVLEYTIGGITKTLSEPITMINIPSDITSSLTEDKIATFKSAFALDKRIIVNKLNNGQVIATSSLNLENLTLK